MNGAFSDKSQFFGDNTAETISRVVTSGIIQGGWNEDTARSVGEAASWWTYGGRDDASGAGVFAIWPQSGTVINLLSHRTILSGY